MTYQNKELLIYNINALVLAAITALFMYQFGIQAWAVGITAGFFVLAIVNGIICLRLQAKFKRSKEQTENHFLVKAFGKSTLFSLIQMVIGFSVCGGAISGVLATVKYYFF